MQIQAYKTRRFSLGESLAPFLYEYLPPLKEKNILVIASKIVALGQHAWMDRPFTDEDIKAASTWSAKTPWAHLTLVDGHWCPNAGMDASNALGGTVLWPRHLSEFLERLYGELKTHYQLSEFGIIVSDSRVFPLRQGVTAVSLAHYGFKALRDYRGEKDLDDRALRMTTVNVADALATAATLLMGEGSESQPVAVIENAPAVFTAKPLEQSLFIDPSQDLFSPLYKGLSDFPLV